MLGVKAYAKLNLYLEVKAKLPNGYHSLESQVAFLEFADEVSIKESTTLSVSGIEIADNLIIKTAKLIQQKHKVTNGAEFTLKKNIPIGAGLGGGSADAAAAILLLNKLWGLNLAEQELYSLGSQIGADVPVCLYAQLTGCNSAFFSGVGDKITPAEKLPEKYYLLVNPRIELATANVFHAFKFNNYPPRTNHLEEAAISIVPQIGDILDILSNQESVIKHSMTGSGSTCFAIFATLEAATAAAKNLDKSWWHAITKPI